METVAAREWYNLYNQNDDVLVVPFTIYANNFQTIETTFELAGVGDHDAVEYIRHGNAQNKGWREIAGLPRPVFLHSNRQTQRQSRNELLLLKMWEKSRPPLRLRLARRVELFLLG